MTGELFWPRRFDGKVVLVTGAARGIGRAIAARFQQEGAAVFSLDVAEAPTAGSKDEISAVSCDVRDEDSVHAAVSRIRDTHDSIDILVNNAGINAYYDPTSLTVDNWETVMGVNLRGAWLCAREAMPYMTKPGGVIINMASVHATVTYPGMFPYGASKAGLLGLTRSLALDYGPLGIRVVAVCPGWVRTALVDEWLSRQANAAEAEAAILAVHALGRMAEPSDIAGCVMFLASSDAAVITGTALVVDGGLSARAPGQ